MGFSTLKPILSLTNAITKPITDAAGNLQQAYAYKAQAKATAQAGDAQARFMERDAAANDAVAMQNNRMMQRNSRSELSTVRTDNADSNLVSDGTGLSREIDMASRLQHEIDIQTNDALRQSSNMRTQAAYTRWDANQQASNLKRLAHGSNMSAIGNLALATAKIGFWADDEWGLFKDTGTSKTAAKK